MEVKFPPRYDRLLIDRYDVFRTAMELAERARHVYYRAYPDTPITQEELDGRTAEAFDVIDDIRDLAKEPK